jgi:hypothetical protein
MTFCYIGLYGAIVDQYLVPREFSFVGFPIYLGVPFITPFEPIVSIHNYAPVAKLFVVYDLTNMENWCAPTVVTHDGPFLHPLPRFPRQI